MNGGLTSYRTDLQRQLPRSTCSDIRFPPSRLGFSWPEVYVDLLLLAMPSYRFTAITVESRWRSEIQHHRRDYPDLHASAGLHSIYSEGRTILRPESLCLCRSQALSDF